MRDPNLWRRLEAYAFDAPGAEAPFSAKLAEEEGWTEAHAKAVVAEYRRFIYLACVSDTQVTPSADIDRAWHLHLSYTRSYWDEMCDQVLGQRLHHEPGKGPSEAARFAQQYAATQALYAEEFHQKPPVAVWRTAEHIRRFKMGWVLSGLGAVIFVLGFLTDTKILWAVALLFIATGAGLVRLFGAKGRKDTSGSGGGSCGGSGCGD